MSGYCPVCGVYCEEDGDRVCAACKAEKKNHYCPECAAKWADEAFAAVRMVKADEIDRLTRENADLRAKLEAVTKDRDNELADNTGLALKIATVSEELDNFKTLASRETSRRLAAEKARDDQAGVLRQAVASCRCRGTGHWQTPCTLCGDSTYDHHCNDETVECDQAWCIAARKALAAAAVKEAGNEQP